MNILYNFVKKHQVSKATFVSFFTIICLSCYFLFYAIYGNNGLLDKKALQKEIERKNSVEQSLSVIRDSKESKVNKMRPESLDFDLLDEEVRRNLGYVEKDEVTIYNDSSQ